MNSNQTFNILFYLRNNRVDNQGSAPIVMRLTINGERLDFSTNRRIKVDKWRDGQPIGSTDEARQIREYMESLRSKIYNIQVDLRDHDEFVTLDKIRDKLYGKPKEDKKVKMLLVVFKEHCDNIEKLVGKDYSNETLKRYNTAKKHVADYIKYQYKCEDVKLTDLNYSFITGLENYLKIERNCNHNSSMKYIKNFRRVINEAVKCELLSFDPFSKFSCKTVAVKRDYLTEDELKALEETEINLPRLDQVRDIFVFCCYTGLAHVDVVKFNKANIIKGIDGSLWINIDRTKTDVNSKIPILNAASRILNKYKSHPVVQSGKCILPTSSNQKMNAYLKEIANIVGITKNLTFHLARHTFATTVTLTNGVPIETVGAMLGHKNLRSTQIYSKVVEQKISNDMKALKKKLDKRDKKG